MLGDRRQLGFRMPGQKVFDLILSFFLKHRAYDIEKLSAKLYKRPKCFKKSFLLFCELIDVAGAAGKDDGGANAPPSGFVT